MAKKQNNVDFVSVILNGKDITDVIREIDIIVRVDKATNVISKRLRGEK